MNRFEQLYAEHAAAVLAYALRRTDAASAADVMSETFVVAWRRLDRVPAEPLPWLYGVARRVLANQRRSARRRALLLRKIEEQPQVAGATTDRPVLEALATLSAKEREVLMLTAWEGLSPTEAASALGCSPNACRIRLHRARAALERALAREQSSGRFEEVTQ